MAGLSSRAYDLAVLHAGLARWCGKQWPGQHLQVSPLSTNPSSGYSSQSFVFDVSADECGEERVEHLVLRLPPAGEGLFPHYDLARQAEVQNQLAALGLPTAAPTRYEPDDEWLGTDFLVMPCVLGRIPNDYLYCVKGWLHDAGRAHQLACCESFADGLSALHRTQIDLAAWRFLERPQGPGLAGELAWWDDYLTWATDGRPEGSIAAAHQWARDTMPRHDEATIVWGDPRFANAVFDADGDLGGMLDWEQASLGPAELDVGWWLATRRQAAQAVGVPGDPELPGFLDRAESVARIEAGLGRRVRDLLWHETYAMVRMGTCITATQALLRRSGQDEHFLLDAPVMPDWAIRVIEGTESTSSERTTI